jgi:hypothetical protein
MIPAKRCRKIEIKQGVSGRPGPIGNVTDKKSWNFPGSDMGIDLD